MAKAIDNHNHDLVQQLSEKVDSVWRYEEYLKNSEGCDRCSAMWQSFLDQDQKMVEQLKAEIKKHVEEDNFN